MLSDKCVRACNIFDTIEEVAKVPLAKHDDVVQALPLDPADQPFGISVLPRRSRWRVIFRTTIPSAPLNWIRSKPS
jgi:hypothetical protein